VHHVGVLLELPGLPMLGARHVGLMNLLEALKCREHDRERQDDGEDSDNQKLPAEPVLGAAGEGHSVHPSRSAIWLGKATGSNGLPRTPATGRLSHCRWSALCTFAVSRMMGIVEVSAFSAR